MHWERVAVSTALLLVAASSIPVDNNVEGEPEIECGPTSMIINFNTRKPFEGHVYVKGMYDEPGCRSDEGGRAVAGIELPFASCNVARTRSMNPKGVFVSTNIVISFHPQFVTKVDRAYRIECFYMESEKDVSDDLSVSDLTTLAQTQVVPMPRCSYDILDSNAKGAPVQFAAVGQQVYHSWKCESETLDTFCMTVHSCVAEDGRGRKIELLDEDGCALDSSLISNINYTADLEAGQETAVFRYADRNQLFYECQIALSIKEPHEECPRPSCTEPTSFGARDVSAGSSSPPPKRSPRPKRSLLYEGNVDVRAQMETVDEVFSQYTEKKAVGGSPSSHFCFPPALIAVVPFILSFFVFLAARFGSSTSK